MYVPLSYHSICTWCHCEYIHTYMHTYIRTHTYIHTHTYMHAYKKTYTRTRGTDVEGCEDVHVTECSCIHQTLTPALTHLCGIYIYIYTCTYYTSIHMYTYEIYVHTCIHILVYACMWRMHVCMYVARVSKGVKRLIWYHVWEDWIRSMQQNGWQSLTPYTHTHTPAWNASHSLTPYTHTHTPVWHTYMYIYIYIRVCII